MGYLKSRYGLSPRELDAISAQWYEEKKRGRVLEFESLDAFFRWSAECEYQHGMKLTMIAPEGPLSPANCQWQEETLSEATLQLKNQLAKKWDAFIAPIRLAACSMGLNPCDHCGASLDCDTICPLRAVYWDAAMEKLRKELGA